MDPMLTSLQESVIEGAPDRTADFTKQALEAGIEPLEVLNQGLIPGMDVVGERFASGEYFIPNLTVAAVAMKRAMEILDPLLQESGSSPGIAGTVVLGTVHGDIHEIGKSLVGTMLSANGFKVHDLGVDVPTERFIETVQRTGAEMLGLSSLLTTTMTVQREVLKSLEEQGLRDRVKVMVGGAPVSQEWAEEIGADGYAEDALGAVRKARKLMAG